MVTVYKGAEGISYMWDETRQKNLSIARSTVLINGPQPGHAWALQVAGAGQASGLNPYIMPRNGTITNVTGMSEQVNSVDMTIYFYNQNGIGARHSDIIFPQTGADASEVVISGGLNHDVEAGDWLRAATDGPGGSILYPTVLVEIAWRDS